jgi:hypothetical protein
MAIDLGLAGPGWAWLGMCTSEMGLAFREKPAAAACLAGLLSEWGPGEVRTRVHSPTQGWLAASHTAT